MLASRDDHKAIAQLLLYHGADVNAQNEVSIKDLTCVH